MNFANEVVAGVDEAGRGPLAGPVVAAAVILQSGHGIDGLADSKKVSPRKREVLAEQIRESCVDCALGYATVEEIDRLNILHATMLAMRRAVHGLSERPGLVLVDGNRLPSLRYPAQAVVRGDSLIESISAASILAKVTRDAELIELDRQFPGYGFSRHKGYPTRQHVEALEELGPSPVHRRSFAPVRAVLERE